MRVTRRPPHHHRLLYLDDRYTRCSKFAQKTRPAAMKSTVSCSLCFLIVFYLYSLCGVNAVKILGLFPHVGKSHHMVFEPLLLALAERGHELTVISHFPLKNKPSSTYKDVSLYGISPIGVEAFDIGAEKPWILKFLENSIFGRSFNFYFELLWLKNLGIETCRRIVNIQTLNETLSEQYDLVIVENFNSDCLLGLAHYYGVRAPVVALSSCNPLPWSMSRLGFLPNPAYIPTTFVDNHDDMNFILRLRNTLITLIVNVWYKYSIQMEEQEIIENSLGRKGIDLPEIAKNTSLVLSNTFYTLNGVKLLPPGLVEVGGMYLKKKLDPLPHYIEKFLAESEHGVILFSWGSLIKTSTISPEKEEIIVRACAKFPQRIIWKYENSGPEGNLTGNLLRVNWLPQYELLQHPKVIAFLAHGGLLGMTEAIASGKPMVVVPFFGDQPHNGAFAAKAGFATVLEYKDITEESLTRAFEKVLSAEVRLKARRVSEMWRDRPMDPLDTAVYWVERVARWGHSDPLYLPGRHMPFYQRLLLDVIAAVVLAIATLLFVMKLIVKIAKRCLLSLLCDIKKQKFD